MIVSIIILLISYRFKFVAPAAQPLPTWLLSPAPTVSNPALLAPIPSTYLTASGWSLCGRGGRGRLAALGRLVDCRVQLLDGLRWS